MSSFKITFNLPYRTSQICTVIIFVINMKPAESWNRKFDNLQQNLSFPYTTLPLISSYTFQPLTDTKKS